jgi:hypothetical protein
MLGVFCIFFDVRNFRAIRNLPCGHNPVRIPPVESPNRPSAAGSKNHRFFGFSGYPRKTGFSGSSGPRNRISGIRTPIRGFRGPDPGNQGFRDPDPENPDPDLRIPNPGLRTPNPGIGESGGFGRLFVEGRNVVVRIGRSRSGICWLSKSYRM